MAVFGTLQVLLGQYIRAIDAAVLRRRVAQHAHGTRQEPVGIASPSTRLSAYLCA